MSTIPCIHCGKICKISDSRPFPGSKSTERIHNRCYIKKTLVQKQKVKHDGTVPKKSFILDTQTTQTAQSSSSAIMDKLIREEEKLRKETEERKLNKIIEAKGRDIDKTDNRYNQFFFDLKAGVLKPHEKKKFLHHRSLCEIAPRYDDHGFQDDAIGRTYDHTGRDLNSLGGSDDEDRGNEKDVKNLKRQHQGYNEALDGSRAIKRPNVINAKSDRTTRIKVDDQNPCWFCLSSVNVEKHLILAIGDHCYLSLAKGGLNDYHFLLLPIEHIQSLRSDANSTELLDELERFKHSLVKYFESKLLGVVFFERNFKSFHWQLQVVPIPIEKIDGLSQGIKSISKNHFGKADYIDIPEKCSIDDIMPPGAPYLFWQIEPVRQRFACQIQAGKGSFFPIQLGRLVLADAKILDCSDRIDWKSCTKSIEDYIMLVKLIKKEYEPFDITSED